MSAWQTEDKEWMKERKRQWASVSKRVNYLYFIDSEWKPAIKDFYLTGAEQKGDFSMSTLTPAPLLALWFDPDDSIKHWQWLRKHRYTDLKWRYSASRLREVLSGLGELPEGGVGSFFDGRDERLYDFFFKRGLKREHHPEMDDEEFNKHAWDVYRGLASAYIHELDTEYSGTPNPYNSVNYRLEEWRDSIILAYDPKRKELEHLLELLDQTLADPENFVKERVDLAIRVNEVLKDPTLPTAFKQRVMELRDRPCHPNCLEEEQTVPPDTHAVIRIVAESKESIVQIVSILEEPVNSELEIESPGGDDTNSAKCEFLERPKEINVDGVQLTASYHIADSEIFEDYLDTVHERMSFEIAYILYGDKDKWYFFEYLYPDSTLMSKTGEDEEVDKRLQRMGWGKGALDCLIEYYG
jgi:hypothetical protein